MIGDNPNVIHEVASCRSHHSDPQVAVMMDEQLLHHLCTSLRSADSAWKAATKSGAEDITQIVNAIHTLQYHAQPQAALPPAGALSKLLEETRQRLEHIQITLRRLRAVIAGVERWREELPSSKLSNLVDEFLTGLREDVTCKNRVVEDLRAVENGAAVEPDRWLALWSEATARLGRPDALFIQAFVEAEATLQPTPSTPRKHTERISQGKQLSPALAMLKRRSLGGV